jgi:hypothetical protein
MNALEEQVRAATSAARTERRRTVRRKPGRPGEYNSALSFRLMDTTHDALCRVALELDISVAEVARRALMRVERRVTERRVRLYP